MAKKSESKPWMPAPDYGRSLDGLSINLLVRDIDRSVAFAREVLGAELVHGDPDFAVAAAVPPRARWPNGCCMPTTPMAIIGSWR